MALPIISQILNAIETRLKTIIKANGYNFDIGDSGKVFKTYAEVPAFPAVYVSDAQETRKVITGQYEVTFDVFFYGWVKSDDRRADIRLLAQDIERMIYVDETWGGLSEVTNVLASLTDRSALISEPYGFLEMRARPTFSIMRGST